MKCGKCRGSHGTVAEVRACYTKMAASPERPAEPPRITDNQLEFLNKLRVERDMYPYPDGTEPGVPRVRLTRKEASDEIDRLIHNVPRVDQPPAPPKVPVGKKALRTVRNNVRIDNATREKVKANNAERTRRTNPQCAQWDLPTGKHRYAIDGEDGRETDFYLVNRPTEGRWAGYTFVKIVVGGKPAYKITSRDRISKILTEIEKDWDAAGARFGIELGQCRHCGIHLTDETSRRLGAGPDCRAKYGVAA